MASKLYVGSLPFSTTSVELRDQFSRCGTVVSANVVIDRVSGQSRGFGFVEMSTPEEASAAIAKLDGQPLAGRRLRVAMANPQPARSDRSFDNGSGRGPGRPTRW
jgi:RNA recognition motif-containing protein